jgi:hypothetical protein
MKFKVILFFYSLFITNFAFSQPLKFSCDGQMSTENSTPSQLSFDMAVTLNPAAIFDYPNRIALGCIDGPDLKEKCQSSDSRVDCKCETSFASSSLMLSRYTGRLDVTTIFKKDNQIFQVKALCRPVSKKMF